MFPFFSKFTSENDVALLKKVGGDFCENKRTPEKAQRDHNEENKKNSTKHQGP